MAVRWEKLRHGQFANIIRTKTFGKGKEGHSFELHLLPPLSAASSTKLHYHGIARSRDEKLFPGRTNSFACVHPLDKGRNDISKRERKMEEGERWIQLVKWVKEKKKFVEFICSCIFDETGKRKKRKTRDNWRNYR